MKADIQTILVLLEVQSKCLQASTENRKTCIEVDYPSRRGMFDRSGRLAKYDWAVDVF